MGYRSDVAYKIWFDDVQLRDACIDLVLATNDEWMIKALKECEIGTEKRYDSEVPLGVIKFEVEDVKWYEGFDDVEGHSRLIRYAERNFEDSCGARMVRMGESDDDIEYDDFGSTELIDYDDVYVHRTLECAHVDDAMSLDDWINKDNPEVKAA